MILGKLKQHYSILFTPYNILLFFSLTVMAYITIIALLYSTFMNITNLFLLITLITLLILPYQSATNKSRKKIGLVFTVFNTIFFFPLLGLAFIAPLCIGNLIYTYTPLLTLIVISKCASLTVPFGIYMAWKNINNPSLTPFLLYMLLPLFAFFAIVAVIILCYVAHEFLITAL